MSWNGSEQLEKAMEEVLDDNDDEIKVEKSNVEKMEKHSTLETSVPEPPAAGISFLLVITACTLKVSQSRAKSNQSVDLMNNNNNIG